MVAVAVAGLHIEISSGTETAIAGSFNSEHLSRFSSLGIEEALSGDSAGRSGDDAAEIRVGGCEAGGHVGEVSSAADVSGVGGMLRSGFAENGRRPQTHTTRHSRYHTLFLEVLSSLFFLVLVIRLCFFFCMENILESLLNHITKQMLSNLCIYF